MKTVFAAILLYVCAFNARATESYVFGEKDSCATYQNGTKTIYYFCGQPLQNDKCKGDGLYKTSDVSKYSFQVREMLNWDKPGDAHYICCTGYSTGTGKWVRTTSPNGYFSVVGNRFSTSNVCQYINHLDGAIVHECDSSRDNCTGIEGPCKSVNDRKPGVCSEITEQDVCASDYRVRYECDITRNPCPDGKYWRNGECINSCSGGLVYESRQSNKCVECTITKFQGPYMAATGEDAGYGKFCMKCEEGVSLYSDVTKGCVALSDPSIFKIYQDSMKKCWGCNNPYVFRQCVSHFEKYKLLGGDSLRDMKKACRIQNDE